MISGRKRTLFANLDLFPSGFEHPGTWRLGGLVENMPFILVGDFYRSGRPLEGEGVCVQLELDEPGLEQARLTVFALPEQASLHIHYQLSEGGFLIAEDGQVIAISWSEQADGKGVRAWFVCPSCGRQRTKLYLDSEFKCRACHRNPYKSKSLSPHQRQLAKANSLRIKYGGRPGAGNPFPPRPKGKHLRTYARDRARTLEYEREYLDGERERAERLLADYADEAAATIERLRTQ
jgi:hypothetical protein